MSRRWWKVTDLDDSNAWVIPRLRLDDWEYSFQTSLLPPVGEDGAFDLHGDRQAPKGPATVPLRFMMVGDNGVDLSADISTMLQALEGSQRTKGKRKLWRYEDTDQSSQRWTEARLAARPKISRSFENTDWVEVDAELLLPDPRFYEALTTQWLADNGYAAETLSEAVVPEPIKPNFTFAVFAINATPFTFTIKNAGDLDTRRIIFRLHSQSTNGFTNPKIENLTTGQAVSSSTDGVTANHILSINAAPGLGQAQLSTDGGSSWSDDTLNLTLGSLQAVLMELVPGDNSFRYTDGGTPNLKLYVWWLHAYRD